jgi:hypothetical protein
MGILTKTDVKQIIETAHNVDLSDKSRRRHIVYLRFIYFKICREMFPGASLDSIGKSVNRNHATVIHALRNFDYVCIADEDFVANYNKTKKMIEDEKNKLQIILENSKKVYGILNVKKIHPHLLRYAKKPLRKILNKGR